MNIVEQLNLKTGGWVKGRERPAIRPTLDDAVTPLRQPVSAKDRSNPLLSVFNRFKTKVRAFRATRKYRKILNGLGAEFTPDSARAGAELVKLGDLSFSIKSEEDLFILTEIFDGQCYNFNTFEETIVIDIGMNIGLASLFFAANPQIQHVYSFEPFATTYQLATANIRRNPAIAAKITAHNFGLSDRDTNQELPYIEERKGSLGINGMPRNFTPAMKDLQVQEIELRDAAGVLGPILDAHPESSVVLKMDCEGSEYEIFQSLDEAGLLGRFRAIMLEWHRKGPNELRAALRKYGYDMFTFGDVPSPSGLVYAVKPTK